MTGKEFLMYYENYEFTREHFEDLKEACEIDLARKWLSNQAYIKENKDIVLLTESADCTYMTEADDDKAEDVENQTEEKSEFFLVKWAKKLWQAIKRFFSWIGKIFTSWGDKGETDAENLAATVEAAKESGMSDSEIVNAAAEELVENITTGSPINAIVGVVLSENDPTNENDPTKQRKETFNRRTHISRGRDVDADRKGASVNQIKTWLDELFRHLNFEHTTSSGSNTTVQVRQTAASSSTAVNNARTRAGLGTKTIWFTIERSYLLNRNTDRVYFPNDLEALLQHIKDQLNNTSISTDAAVTSIVSAIRIFGTEGTVHIPFRFAGSDTRRFMSEHMNPTKLDDVLKMIENRLNSIKKEINNDVAVGNNNNRGRAWAINAKKQKIRTGLQNAKKAVRSQSNSSGGGTNAFRELEQEFVKLAGAVAASSKIVALFYQHLHNNITALIKGILTRINNNNPDIANRLMSQLGISLPGNANANKPSKKDRKVVEEIESSYTFLKRERSNKTARRNLTAKEVTAVMEILDRAFPNNDDITVNGTRTTKRDHARSVVTGNTFSPGQVEVMTELIKKLRTKRRDKYEGSEASRDASDCKGLWTFIQKMIRYNELVSRIDSFDNGQGSKVQYSEIEHDDIKNRNRKAQNRGGNNP